MSCPVILNYLGSVTSRGDLPVSGNTLGDVRFVRDDSLQYYWSISSSTGSLADWKVINGPIISDDEKSFHELLNEYKMALETSYETYSYTGSRLTLKEVWTDNTLTTKLFSRTFSYTGSRLDSDVVTRISDGVTLTRTYSYTGSKLTSVEYS